MIADNTFAAACYDSNSIDELEHALANGPDEIDMKTWGITADEWRESIQQALEELRNDA